MSHSIPNALFRLISKKSNGKLVQFTSDDRKNRYTTDTGDAPLLCTECEATFNTKFDAPFINAIKKWDRGIIESGFGYRLEYSPSQIAQSLASIFWRAGASENLMYDNAKISKRDSALMKDLIEIDQKHVFKYCSCAVRRLYHRGAMEEGGFKQEDFSQIILPAFALSAGWNGIRRGHFGYAAIMQGFLFFLVLPRLPYNKRCAPTYLQPFKTKIYAPTIHFLDIQPLAELIVVSLKKELEGKTTLKKSPH